MDNQHQKTKDFPYPPVSLATLSEWAKELSDAAAGLPGWKQSTAAVRIRNVAAAIAFRAQRPDVP
jgi:hypothetical protein